MIAWVLRLALVAILALATAATATQQVQVQVASNPPAPVGRVEVSLTTSSYDRSWLGRGGPPPEFALDPGVGAAEARCGLRFTNLPPFHSDQPLFGFIEVSDDDWIQNQVKAARGRDASGQFPRVLRYPLALDEAGGPGTGYTALHVDSDGDGSFATGRVTVYGYLTLGGWGYWTCFPPVRLRVAPSLFGAAQDAPTFEVWAVHEATEDSRGRILSVRTDLNSLARGSLVVPGVSAGVPVVVADSNSDGDCLDPGTDLLVIGDRVWPLSRLMVWQGRLWDVEISPRSLRLGPHAGPAVRVAVRASDGLGRPLPGPSPLTVRPSSPAGRSTRVVACFPEELILPPGSYTVDYGLNLAALTHEALTHGDPNRPGAAGLCVSASVTVPSATSYDLLLGGPLELALKVGQPTRGKVVEVEVSPRTRAGHRIVGVWGRGDEPITLEVPDAPVGGVGPAVARRVGIGFG